MIGRDPREWPIAPSQNLLLASLKAEVYADLLPHLEWVTLPEGWIICHAGGDLDHVYFPTCGIVSLLYELENGNSVEVALTGNDGLVGVHILTGAGASTSRAAVRNTGHAYRIRAAVLKEKFETCPVLRQPMLLYVHALIAQVTQTAVCHCHHRLEQQFARLLLLTLDRLPSNEMPLTHDKMAGLLGVRRESITAAAGNLQESGLIRYHRGRVTVLNRPLLEARVCECYAVVKTELERLSSRLSPATQASASISFGLSDTTRLRAWAPVEHIRKDARPHRSVVWLA